VERIAGQSDRRSMLVGLTAKGKSLIDHALSAHLGCEAPMLLGLSSAERGKLAALLRKLLHGIEDQHGPQ
jgi:DNA-binding MarR family transcriptional regulator